MHRNLCCDLFKIDKFLFWLSVLWYPVRIYYDTYFGNLKHSVQEGIINADWNPLCSTFSIIGQVNFNPSIPCKRHLQKTCYQSTITDIMTWFQQTIWNETKYILYDYLTYLYTLFNRVSCIETFVVWNFLFSTVKHLNFSIWKKHTFCWHFTIKTHLIMSTCINFFI